MPPPNYTKDHPLVKIAATALYSLEHFPLTNRDERAMSDVISILHRVDASIIDVARDVVDSEDDPGLILG